MKKYHFRINNGISDKKNDAGNKAVADCRRLLLDNGYSNLETGFFKSSLLLPFNLIKLFVILSWYLIKIPAGSLIFTQYPLLGINRPFRHYARLLKRLKKCPFACIIHDLDSIRAADAEEAIPKELVSLSVYDAVISHNPVMTGWLRDHGYRGSITEIGFFDYLSDKLPPPPAAPPAPGHYRVIFAGSLFRTNFLHLTGNIPNLQLGLYGPGFDTLADTRGLTWHGSFGTGEIVHAIQGHSGLVWDGDSIEGCRGVMGNYLKFNTSHKVSLYLLAGMPVIVPQCAAICPLITAKGLGIAVSSLKEIPEKIALIDKTLYREMIENIEAVRKAISMGEYFQSALKRAGEALL